MNLVRCLGFHAQLGYSLIPRTPMDYSRSTGTQMSYYPRILGGGAIQQLHAHCLCVHALIPYLMEPKASSSSFSEREVTIMG